MSESPTGLGAFDLELLERPPRGVSLDVLFPGQRFHPCAYCGAPTLSWHSTGFLLVRACAGHEEEAEELLESYRQWEARYENAPRVLGLPFSRNPEGRTHWELIREAERWDR